MIDHWAIERFIAHRWERFATIDGFETWASACDTASGYGFLDTTYGQTWRVVPV